MQNFSVPQARFLYQNPPAPKTLDDYLICYRNMISLFYVINMEIKTHFGY